MQFTALNAVAKPPQRMPIDHAYDAVLLLDVYVG